MAKNYDELAKDIVSHIGGKENVVDVRHCMTRLRFRLKDNSVADTNYLKQREGIVTVVESGGQYQVVIGNHVPDVYQAVLQTSGITAGGSLDIDEGDGNKGSLFDRFVDTISALFQPFLGVLSAAGILKGLAAIAVAAGMSRTDGAYIILNVLGDGLFQFLPMILALTSARRFKMNEFTALAIAGAMVYPNLSKLLEEATFFGIPISLPTGGYLSTVLPIVLAILFAAQLEKQLKKFIPDVVKGFLIPAIVIFITVPLAFLIIGPVANTVSKWVGDAFLGIYGFSPILYGLVLGATWQVLVMFGLHWGIIPLAIADIATNGQSIILVATYLACFTQTGVLTAIWLRTKEEKVKTGVVPAIMSSIFGVTEPAIYGYTLPMRTPFFISCAISGLVGAYLSIFNVIKYANGGLGIFVYPTFIEPSTGNMSGVMHMLIGTVIAFIAAFVLQMMFPVPTLYADASESAVSETVVESVETVVEESVELTQEVMASPLTGDVIAMENVPDPVFASGALGKGVAVKPTVGEVYSPVKGEITTVFPTGHAVGITSENGAEILIHIGIDTVQMEGKGFTTHIQQGDTVEPGTKLVTFDITAIEEAGYSTVTPVIITNTDRYSDVLVTQETSVSNGDYLLTVVK